MIVNIDTTVKYLSMLIAASEARKNRTASQRFMLRQLNRQANRAR
jgi:hypothetical protein